MLKIGLVGLPNAGKSTFFNFLTNKSVPVGSYPFTTINSNIAEMPLYDARLIALQRFFNAKKIVNSAVKLWDIAGLIKGAHNGAGLGNQFLSYIREVDAICYVVGGFSLENNDPLEDFLTGKLEIMLSDCQILKKFLTNKVHFWTNYDYNFKRIPFLLQKALTILKNNQFLSTGDWTAEEWGFLSKLNLLTTKKVLVVINVANDFFLSALPKKITKLTTFLQKAAINYLFLPVQFLQTQMKSDSESWKRQQLKYNYHLNGVEHFSNKILATFAYHVFYTASPREVRAWLFSQGLTARACGGLIHSDFAKNFIRLRVLPFQKWFALPLQSLDKVEKHFATVGANYIVQNGDICHFLINRSKNE